VLNQQVLIHRESRRSVNCLYLSGCKYLSSDRVQNGPSMEIRVLKVACVQEKDQHIMMVGCKM
jgi:hypothetical protein